MSPVQPAAGLFYVLFENYLNSLNESNWINITNKDSMFEGWKFSNVDSKFAEFWEL